MARPSVKEERTEEILQAYERCIALYGVEGATLQKIAEQADMARPLLRHHVGNSEQLLEMAVTRYVQRSEESMRNAYALLPADCTGQDFIDLLFHTPSTESENNDVMIAAALIYASQTNPMIKTHMQIWLKNFIESFTKQLQHFYPDAPENKVKDISAGIIGIYFNVASLTPLGNNTIFSKQSYQAALYLLQALTNKKDET